MNKNNASNIIGKCVTDTIFKEILANLSIKTTYESVMVIASGNNACTHSLVKMYVDTKKPTPTLSSLCGEICDAVENALQNDYDIEDKYKHVECTYYTFARAEKDGVDFYTTINRDILIKNYKDNV